MTVRPALTAALLVLLLPFASSAPLSYVGTGSGTLESDETVPGFEGCDRFDIVVQIHPSGDGWIPTAHRVFRNAAGQPCNLGWMHGIENPVLAARVEGSPETGFLVDFASDGCSQNYFTLGPVGPSTAYKHVSVECDSYVPDETETATVAFHALG